MRYELAIFDFDGTLADSADWMLGVFNLVAKRHRFRQVSEAEIAMLRGRSSREIVRYLRVPAWRLPAIARHVRALSAEAAGEITLFDGVERLLADLAARGVRLAVVSSNGEGLVRQVLGEANAGRVAIFDCGAALFGKARRFRKVARAAGVTPGRVLCIGDETRDIEAAAKAGMASAAVAWGYATRAVLAAHRPTHLVETMDELIAAAGG